MSKRTQLSRNEKLFLIFFRSNIQNCTEVLLLLKLVFNPKTNFAPRLLINDLTTPKTMTFKQITCNLNGNSKIRRLVRSIIQITGENSVKNANILKDYLLFLLPSFIQHDDRIHYNTWI